MGKFVCGWKSLFRLVLCAVAGHALTSVCSPSCSDMGGMERIVEICRMFLGRRPPVYDVRCRSDDMGAAGQYAPGQPRQPTRGFPG
ncbi:hypothetical protein GGR56DRAFT_631005 [Xylariaceae sp. FL0804]|nr:hypothetical protein GGR56DRAFT_631005 [Xylariaceae sp. FL0804]